MERDVLMKRSALRKHGWRAAAVALLVFAFCIAIATPGCGKKKNPPSSQVTSLPGGEKTSGAAIRDAAATEGEPEMPAGRDASVYIVPTSPSRIAPPSISVRSFPGQGAQIENVRWIVNGSEQAEGETLPPSLFARGDEIGAIVKVRSERGETLLPTEKVVAVNAMPAVTKVDIDPRALTAGETVRAVVEARDPDGDPLTFKYQWYIDKVPVPGKGDSLDLKGVRKGSMVHVAVTPNDGFTDGAWKNSSLHETVNAPPVVKSKAPTTIPPSRVLTHTIVAEDPDGDPLTYTLVKGTEGMALAGPTLTWKLSDEDIGRPAEIVIRISDNQGGETALTMTLTPNKP
jgi:hypothetical protein